MRFLTLAACAATFALLSTVQAEARQIRKQADFVALLAGKTLTAGDSWIVLSADGKIKGVTSKGDKVVGAWIWNKRFLCRNIYLGQQQLPQDCQTVEVEGNNVTFTRDRGKGTSSTFNF